MQNLQTDKSTTFVRIHINSITMRLLLFLFLFSSVANAREFDFFNVYQGIGTRFFSTVIRTLTEIWSLPGRSKAQWTLIPDRMNMSGNSLGLAFLKNGNLFFRIGKR
jgi:hypothetical protein